MTIIDNRSKYDLKLAKLISSDNDAYQSFTAKMMNIKNIDRHIDICKISLGILKGEVKCH